MPANKQAIDLATRGELENMMALEKLPNSRLTLVFGYRQEYTFILKLILRALNCLKVVAEKKDMELDIRAFIELPKNFEELELYHRWLHYKKLKIGYSKNFQIEELRKLYPVIESSRNYYLENTIDRGNSINFFNEWKGILAKCATQHPNSKNKFKICEAKDPLSIAIKPFQILRDAKLIKIESLPDFKDAKVNGRLEMTDYMYISGIQEIMHFIQGSFTPPSRRV